MSATTKQNRSINKRANLHRDGTTAMQDRMRARTLALLTDAERAKLDPAFVRRVREAACQQAFENNAATPEAVRDAVADLAAVEAIFRRTKKSRRKTR